MGAAIPAIQPARVLGLSCRNLLMLSILPVRGDGGEATLHAGRCGGHIEVQKQANSEQIGWLVVGGIGTKALGGWSKPSSSLNRW